MPISALFSWWFLRNWFINPLVHKTKNPSIHEIEKKLQSKFAVKNSQYSEEKWRLEKTDKDKMSIKWNI